MKNMTVNVLRGENEIGENLIEVEAKGVKILLECGEALNPTERTKRLEEEVVKKAYDAVFVTHSHIDHSGLLKRPLCSKKIFMGEKTFSFLRAEDGVCEENVRKTETIRDGKSFFVGEVELTPYLCDHSAYDSYMIGLACGGDHVLYTGDFRSNGRKSFPRLLERLPKDVDLLVCEGTSSRENHLTERALEDEMVKLFQAYDRVFVLSSGQNVDRTVSVYRASKRSGKRFIQHKKSAERTIDLPNVPDPVSFADCFTYVARRENEIAHKRTKEIFGDKLLGRAEIAKSTGYVMQITSSMKSYLQEMDKIYALRGSLCVYSVWDGYKEKMSELLSFLDRIGIRTVSLHTSGHADLKTVRRLIQTVRPKETVFVHTHRDIKK